MNNDATRKPTTPAGWREKTWEARKATGVPLDLPSGVTVLVNRPRFTTWYGTARLPDYLANNVVKVFGAIDDESPDSLQHMSETLDELTAEEQNQIGGFMNNVIMDAVVQPRVVDKLPEDCGEDEMSLTEIGEEDRAWIMLFVFEGGSSVIPVPTKGGDVPMASLKSAGAEQPGAGAGEGLREVQTKSR